MSSMSGGESATKQKQQQQSQQQISPVDELQSTIVRLEKRIATIRERYMETIIPKQIQAQQAIPSSSTSSNSVLRWFGRKSVNGTTTTSVQTPLTPDRNKSSSTLEPTSNVELKTPSLTPDTVQRGRKERRRIRREPVADFIPFQVGTEPDDNLDETIDSFVEDLRRLAEMCIIGENFITRTENKKAEKFKKQQEQWVKARNDLVDMIDTADTTSGADDSEREADPSLNAEKMQLFDLFFENNGLGMIVDLLTGKTFQLLPSEKELVLGINTATKESDTTTETASTYTTATVAAAPVIESKLSLDKSSSHSMTLSFWSSSKEKEKEPAPVPTDTPVTMLNKEEEQTSDSVPSSAETPQLTAAATTTTATNDNVRKDNDDEKLDVDSPEHPCNKTMLPPLRIAIQALQSISILIQNVSRATSLYVILSNNHINALIALPTTLYATAERRREQNAKEISILPSYTMQSTNTSISELSSHFVTFLKSLAMRINAETVQFFLTYPSDHEHNEKVRKLLLSSQQQLSPTKSNSKGKRSVRRTKSNDVRSIAAEKYKNQRSNSADLGSLAAGVISNMTATTGASTSPKSANIGDEIPSLSTNYERERSISEDEFDRMMSTSEGKDSGKSDNTNSFYSSVSYQNNSILSSSQDPRHQQVMDLKFISVQFPLYERALEFCSTIHDSMVRLTAMNICLNTLRLVTVDEDSSTSNNSTPDKAAALSPDGVLHNAEALPFPERIAIAQLACTPSRVELLISPIFAKLAERWNAIEEQIRQIDSNKHMGINRKGTIDGPMDDSARSIGKTDESVRTQRLIRSFKDRVADLEDDLYILEDVFKVGMTVLNEQCIEMMLATFVYPLLVQPLLTYYKEYTDAVDETRLAFSDHPFGGIGADLSDIDKALLPVACPAKAAMFATASVFQTITNKPLLRLLFTLVLHTLSPDSTKAPTVRSKLQVATESKAGRKIIRVDQANVIDATDRSTYAFGTLQQPDTAGRVKIPFEEEEDSEACIFVLAPALAEVLEFDGSDTSLLSRCGPNPYRRALFEFLSLPDAMSDIRELATCTIDAALSVFEGRFASDVLFGVDLKSIEERTDSDDNEDSESTVINKVVFALVDCSVFAIRVASNDWTLGYDEIGAQALLRAIRRNPHAIGIASTVIEERLRKAASLFSVKPSEGLIPMGSGNVAIPGSPTVNDDDFEDRMFDMFIDYIFFDSVDLAGKPIAETELLQLKTILDGDPTKAFSIQLSKDGTSEVLTSRIGTFFVDSCDHDETPLPEPFDRKITRDRREGIVALIKLDALSTLCKSLAATDGYAIHDSPFTSITFASNGSRSSTAQSNRGVISPISSGMSQALFTVGNGSDPLPTPMSSINLSSCDLLPCVCEAPASAAHFFADDHSGIVAEGVTWQSLYIVFAGEYLVFAQPIPGQSGGIGRVISSCGLAQLIVQTDPGPIQQGGPARRLLFSHKWFDRTPPPLFLYDNIPEPPLESPPFVHVKTFVSRLDVWFEHQRATDHAFKMLNSRIFDAKAKRGVRLQSFLATISQ